MTQLAPMAFPFGSPGAHGRRLSPTSVWSSSSLALVIHRLSADFTIGSQIPFAQALKKLDLFYFFTIKFWYNNSYD
jgi:hypothetical protein